MAFVHRDGCKAPAKEMAPPAPTAVDEVCPTLVRGAGRAAEIFPIVRAEHRIHTIWHEASGPHFNFRFARLPGKHVATDVLVAVPSKKIGAYRLPRAAT